jgi:hypothetical protein
MADNVMRLGLVLSATDKMSRVVDQAVTRSSARLKKFAEASSRISGAYSLIGGAALTAGILSAASEAGKQAKANKRLESVFRSMWGDSGAVKEAAKNQEELANKLSMSTGVDADIIKQTQAKIATFQHLSNKTAIMSGVFDRATRASIDMAAVGFGEATQNAVTLGKALEDPINMATALKRMGTLTANDIIEIQAIMRTKGLAAAQEVLLKAVERQVGGAAEATASATDIMRQSWLRVDEALGKVFLPTLKKNKQANTSFAQSIVDLIGKHASFVGALAYTALGIFGVGMAIRGVTSVIGVWKKAIALVKLMNLSSIFSFDMLRSRTMYATGAIAKWGIASKISAAGQWVLNAATAAYNAILLVNPIVWIIAGIIALVAAVVICWKKFAVFRAVIKTTWEVIKGFGIILKDYVLDRIKGIISGVGSLGKAIGLLFHGKFSEAFDVAKKGVRELSGYDAKVKALQRSKALISSVSTTYKNTLANERKKDTESSLKTIDENSNVGNTSSNTNQKMVYSPTIHIQGTSSGDLSDLKKVLGDNKAEMWKFMTQVNRNNARTSTSN